jgi:sugar O-acyltransferase (sialic acid O-acetyltransferase NeuD family)
MADTITEIRIPKETVSDDEYKVGHIRVKDGEAVKAGQFLASFETSKSSIDLEAPADGFVFINPAVGDAVKVGQLFAVICGSDVLPKEYFAGVAAKEATEPASSDKQAPEHGGKRISKSAMELIVANNIDVSVFTGKKLITKEDVEFYLKRKNATDTKITFGSKPKVVIIGAGGHAKICIDILRHNKHYEIAGATSNNKDQQDIMGVPVLGTDDEVLEKLYNEGVRFAVIGIGSLQNLARRQEIFERVKKIGFHIPTIIHPGAIYEPSCSFGEGCQVMAGAIIGSDVRISDNCIINAGSVTSHDCYLESNVHLTPGAILAGNVYVGQNSIIGMGATIYLGVIIGKQVIVSNNSNVLKDIPDNSMVAGNPSQII